MHEGNKPEEQTSTPATPATPAAPLLSRKNLFDSVKAVIEDDPSIVEELSVDLAPTQPGKL